MEFGLVRGSLRAAVSSRGAELVSFKDGAGTEYIWSGDPAYWFGRNPLLFPIVGNLKNGAVRIEGRQYSMNRHGFARDCEFAVTEQTEDSITLELRESEDTLSRYPYKFSLQVRHSLTEEGFVTSFKVENRDERSMPFCIGAHTAFRCPIYEGESFEDYSMVFDRPETAAMTRLTEEGLVSHSLREPFLEGQNSFPLDYDLFARVDTVILKGLESTGVSLAHRDGGHGVHVEFAGFPLLAFWTKGAQHAPFVCIEPWQGCAAVDNESGDFEDKPCCVMLQPGESRSFSYTVSVMGRKTA